MDQIHSRRAHRTGWRDSFGWHRICHGRDLPVREIEQTPTRHVPDDNGCLRIELLTVVVGIYVTDIQPVPKPYVGLGLFLL